MLKKENNLQSRSKFPKMLHSAGLDYLVLQLYIYTHTDEIKWYDIAQLYNCLSSLKDLVIVAFTHIWFSHLGRWTQSIKEDRCLCDGFKHD